LIPPEGLFEPKLHSRAMQKHVIRRPFAWPLLVSCYRNRAAVQVLAVATNAANADWREGDHFSGSTASDEGQSISSRIIVGCSGHQSAAASVAKNSSASRANASCKSRVRAAGPDLCHAAPPLRMPRRQNWFSQALTTMCLPWRPTRMRTQASACDVGFGKE
jgi:hypothetical protein